MLFNSINYLLFFVVVFVVHFALPHRFRYLFLLAASYFFYMCWNASYALLMVTSTLVTYLSGLLIQKYHDAENRRAMKLCVAVSFIVNLAILCFFKYINFLLININELFHLFGSAQSFGMVNVLLPVGISFYTFQALGYTVDVYRQDIKAEPNVCKYALFVSFFPQLVAGPIERSVNLLPQIDIPKKFDIEKARKGLTLIAWGLFMKMVIADQLSLVVNPIYDRYAEHSGIALIIATVLFAFQIYCDFAAYSYIAVGSGKILGFEFMENFRSPYFATSVADFWRRWHISLSTWFADYLYIPLGGNRKGLLRKYANTMLVFLVSGFWHGADWSFVIWGVLNGLLVVGGDILRSLRKQKTNQPESKSRVFFKRTVTFLLMNGTWVFFRANNVQSAFEIFEKIATDLSLHSLFSVGIFSLWPNTRVLFTACCAVAALLFVDSMRNRGTIWDEWLARQGGFIRWSVYMGLLFSIILFGVYGKIFANTQFIYFQF